MKISLDIDCTAAEVREVLGLPDVKKVQDEWMQKVSEQLMEDAQSYSPEKILDRWVSGAGTNMDWLGPILSGLAPGAASKK